MGVEATSVTRQSQVSLKTVFTVSLAILLVVGVVYFLAKTEVAAILSIGAAMVAVALDHSVAALTRRGLSRPLALGLVAVILLILSIGLGVLLIPSSVTQGRLLIQQVPTLWERAEHSEALAALNERLGLEEALHQSAQAAMGAVAPLFTAIKGVFSLVAGLVTMALLSVFMLVFGGKLVDGGLALIPSQHRERYQRVLSRIYDSVGAYVGGLLGICTVNALLTTLFMAALRMPFFLPLGFLSGLSSLIPYAGPAVVATVSSVLVFLVAGPWKALATVIYFVLYGQLEGNILGPFVYRRAVHVNPLVTFLSILFFTEFAGIAGAVIAVPVAAAGQIIGRELMRLRSDPSEPAASA